MQGEVEEEAPKKRRLRRGVEEGMVLNGEEN